MISAKLLRLFLTILLVLFIFFSLPLVCSQKLSHGHSHEAGHGHSHEAGHGHSHGAGHGHSHEPAHGHSHEHETIEEPPSFKYSREANKHYVDDQDIVNDHEHQDDIPTETHPSNPNMWIEAMGATILISIAPYLILFFIPVNNSKEHEPYLKILLAFASGGLLGDAFLHLIPHALMAQGTSNLAHSHSHSHSHAHSERSSSESSETHGHDTVIGVSVLCGIITFLIVEKFVRIFKGGHSHSHSAIQEDSHSVREDVKNNSKKDPNNKNTKSKVKVTKKKSNGDMKVAGYLNLAADFTHNFTDGLAIGASFLAGKSVGIVTTFTIFLHEIPHEIGDFAILLQSGCSRKKAMGLQLITAFGAISGTWISLMAEGSGELAVTWILPFTAGGFIYIATVSVIPELLENSHFWQSVAEVIALLLGVALMMVISWLEEMGHM